MHCFYYLDFKALPRLINVLNALKNFYRQPIKYPPQLRLLENYSFHTMKLKLCRMMRPYQ
jgi:hypothetical protein